MPEFDESSVSPAPPEQVWKLLYDPARFPEWWAGVGSVQAGDAGEEYIMFPDGYPDFPMPQSLRTSRDAGTVTISCQVSDLCFAWRLCPSGAGTEIRVHVEIPDAEAHRLGTQRQIIRQSLARLAERAAAGG